MQNNHYGCVRCMSTSFCGSRSFSVDVPENSGDDTPLSVRIDQCKTTPRITSDAILVIFRLTRVFNGHHLYHVLNNFVVNLDPKLLDKYVFHCWDCSVEFSEFFDRVLNVNSRFVSTGCFKNFIFLGENYATYNVSRQDKEKARRWRDWAHIFKNTWCPHNIFPFDDRYFTHLDRSGAQNGRNMNHCKLGNHTHTRYVKPSLENVEETSKIFCNTRLLMSAEGNGLTNMLLMPSNSVIVVVWQANRHTVALKVIYGNLAKLLGFSLVAIPVQSDDMFSANCSHQLNELFDALM